MTDTAESLDPLRLPLIGERLIEASAGTGKTFTSAALSLRLLLGLGGEAAYPRAISVEELLVVTFTEAATEELRGRIRSNIHELRIACLRGESDNPLYSALLAEIDDKDDAAKTLTLEGVSPVTLFFSDRPERIAGNMTTAKFVPFWSEGKDSFLQDPPNADLSIIENGELRQTVVVLRDPQLDGEDLRYRVEIVDGEMPRTGSEVSVFIDVIGMPATPLSYAGVARRSYRRAVMY